MYSFSGTDEIAHADKTVLAMERPSKNRDNHSFTRLAYPDVAIRNRGARIYYGCLAEGSEKLAELRKDIDEYNRYLDEIEAIPNFLDVFAANNYCISRAEALEKWPEKTVDLIFSKKSYIFDTQMKIFAGSLFDVSKVVEYETAIGEETMLLPIGDKDDASPKKAGERTVLWNWEDHGYDFCLYLWILLGEPEQGDEDETDENIISYYFDYYDEIRFENPPEPQLLRIFNKLEDLGYIKSYTIKTAQNDPRMQYYCKSDGSLDCALVDTSFLKNKLVMEQIDLLLWATPEKLTNLPYFIIDEDNKQKLSSAPGTLGGHKKLKIYGRLDCPSAAKFLRKGQYAQHRVFFADEETAVAAGYRPCGVCMKEAYKRWKTHEAN